MLAEKAVQAIDTGRMAATDRCHLDDLSFEKLHSGVLAKDGTGHAVILVDRELMRSGLDGHELNSKPAGRPVGRSVRPTRR